MKTITQDELERVLEEHSKWLKTRYSPDIEGKCANLSDTDLSHFNLVAVDLRDAILRDADLSYAVLEDANLKGAELEYADLSHAILTAANLSCTSLKNAKLSWTNLIEADLSGATLYYTNLNHANLTYANLRNADLRNADLEDAILNHANLIYANLPDVNLTDAELGNANLIDTNLRGSCLNRANLNGANLKYAKLDQKEKIRLGIILKEDLKGFKKCYNSENNGCCIVELLIPKGSIVFSIDNKECRSNHAKVISIKNMKNTKDYDKAYSWYNNNFVYEVGKEIEVDDFNCQYNIACASGIHFYRTKTEAINHRL